jgi:hypothetical protein
VLEALVENAPPEDYSPAPAGRLTAELVWSSYFETVFGVAGSLSGGVPDLASILRATLDPDRRTRYAGSSEALRGEVERRVGEVLGAAGVRVFELVARRPDCVPLALATVCEALFSDGVPQPGEEGRDLDEADPEARELERDAHDARIRFELLFGRFDGIDAARSAGRELAKAARELALESSDSGEVEQLDASLRGVDEILAEIGATSLAHRISITSSSLDQRIERLGAALLEVVKRPDAAGLARCLALLHRVERHLRSKERPRVIGRAAMACRVLAWLARPALPIGADVEAHARRYITEGAFVDWAREELVGGEGLDTVSRAWVAIEAAAYQRRREENREFAALVGSWFEHGEERPGLVPVERAIERVIAPVIESVGRVLWIVLDGMNWPVALQLLADEELRKIAALASIEGKGTAAALISLVATLPSVTEFSRTSLLAGELARGGQQQEKRAFADNAALSSRSGRDLAPLVLHKGELTEGGRGALTSTAEEAIRSKRPALAVVINAVDDDLGGAQQVRSDWSIDRIRPLMPLIRCALDEGRVVVVASDHGHVHHRHGQKFESDGGGDRWRKVSGTPRDGEIIVRGRRVRELSEGAEDLDLGEPESGAILVPWDEAIHYGAPKNGYHGGITPQELLAPFFILHDKWKTVPGLVPAVFEAPKWWRLDASEVASAPVVPEARAAAVPGKKRAAAVVPASAPLPGAAWIEALFASEIYATQRQYAGKFAPGPEPLRCALEVLVAEAGSMTQESFASRVGVQLPRLAGFVAQLQRILNVDGYDVLVLDRERNRVGLDVPLLRKQFGVGEG